MQNVETFYNAVLLPELNILEQRRLAVKRKRIKILVIACVIALIVGVILQDFIWPLVIIALAAAIAIFGFSNTDDFINKNCKEKIVRQAAAHFFEGIIYEPHEGFLEDYFNAINLFDREPDKYHSEDYFSGKKDKTTYSFSEVNAEYKTETTVTDKNGHTTTITNWHTIFKGIIFVADFKKNFNDIVLITSDTLNFFGNKNTVKMEDPFFEEVFDVYANDDIEARYLITPNFMEQFVALNNNFGGGIQASFLNNEIVIAIPISADYFEANTWGTLLNDKKVKLEIDMIYNLINIVDQLDLNTRIWTKK